MREHVVQHTTSKYDDKKAEVDWAGLGCVGPNDSPGGIPCSTSDAIYIKYRSGLC